MKPYDIDNTQSEYRTHEHHLNIGLVPYSDLSDFIKINQKFTQTTIFIFQQYFC